MSRSVHQVMRLVAPLSAAAALAMSSVAVLAQAAPTITSDCSTIHFELANPSPGARVELGNSVVEGVATDTRAPYDTLGIDRIDVFLDSREPGGIYCGSYVSSKPS